MYIYTHRYIYIYIYIYIPVAGQAVGDSKQLPRPVDRLFLEVVAEGPRAQHLEEGVVVATSNQDAGKWPG